jgi:hypothetical protein
MEDYDEIDWDAPPTKEQIERAKPDIDFLKNCGMPHDITDAWALQDFESYIMCIKNLCDKENLSFDIFYKDYIWQVRSYNPKIGKRITFPVECGKPPLNKYPKWQAALRDLAIAINEAWL